jgi:hypothetical protein
MKKAVVVLGLAALSTFAIMCKSTTDYGTTVLTPELRNVVQIESAVTGLANRGIRAGDFEDWICPPEWPTRAWNKRGLRAGGEKPDPESRKATIADLQQLRDLVSRRTDDAFRAGANVSAYRDLLSLKVSGNVVEGHLNAPQSIGGGL